MIIETQINSKNLLTSLRSGLKSQTLCIDQSINIGGQSFYIDHFDISDDTALNVTQFPNHAPELMISQPVTVALKSFSELQSAPDDGTSEASGLSPIITLRFILSADVESTGASVTVKYLDLIPPPGLTPAEEFVLKFTVLANMPGPQSSVIDLSPFSQILSNTQPTRAEISATADGSRLAVRMSVGEPTQFDANVFWDQFFAGTFLQVPANKDWAVVIDGQAFIDTVGNIATAALQDMIDQGKFEIETGPAGVWLGNEAVVALHGEVIDACDFLFISINMGEDLTFTFKMSLAAKNKVRVDLAVDQSSNKLAVFACALADTLFFGPNGIKLMQGGFLTEGQFWGGMFADLIPPLVFGFVWDKLSNLPISDSIPNQENGITLTKVDPTSHDAEVQGVIDVKIPSLGSLGSMTLDTVTGSIPGQVFAGTLSKASDVVPPTLGVVVNKWTWAANNQCDPSEGYSVSATVSVYANESTPIPIVICGEPYILEKTPDGVTNLDPANQFTAAKMTDDGYMDFTFTIPENKVKAAYTSKPYNCYVWLDTSAGKRVVNLGSFSALTQAEKDQINKGALSPTCAGVNSEQIWGGKWDPHWLIDPGPEGEVAVSKQAWQFIINNLPDANTVTAHIGEQQIATATSVNAIAHLSVLTTPEQGRTLSLTREGKGGTLAKGSKIISMNQSELAFRGSFSFASQAHDVAVGQVGGRTFMAVKTDHGINAYDVTKPHMITDGAALLIPGLAGVMFDSQKVFAYGSFGVEELSFKAERFHRGHNRFTGQSVKSLVRAGAGFIALTDRGINIFDRAFKMTNHIDLPNAVAVNGDRAAIVVATKEELISYDPAGKEVRSRQSLGGVKALTKIPNDGRSGVFFAEVERGGVVIGHGRKAELRQLESYKERPWFAQVRTSGSTMVFPSAGGAGADIYVATKQKTVQM
ncbi:MAG TPA: hypothetical protein VFC63_19035 [Blastocatellia bacterium]|nr:hypothetical protein [Blastocatellia bacterium]